MKTVSEHIRERLLEDVESAINKTKTYKQIDIEEADYVFIVFNANTTFEVRKRVEIKNIESEVEKQTNIQNQRRTNETSNEVFPNT